MTLAVVVVVVARGQHLFFRTTESQKRQGTFSCEPAVKRYAG